MGVPVLKKRLDCDGNKYWRLATFFLNPTDIIREFLSIHSHLACLPSLYLAYPPPSSHQDATFTYSAFVTRVDISRGSKASERQGGRMARQSEVLHVISHTAITN